MAIRGQVGRSHNRERLCSQQGSAPFDDDAVLHARFLHAASGLAAQSTDYAAIRDKQREANNKVGPRTVPIRVIPVPDYFDPATAALVAAPYSTFWDLNPPNDAAWRAIVTRAAMQLYRDLPESGRLWAFPLRQPP